MVTLAALALASVVVYVAAVGAVGFCALASVAQAATPGGIALFALAELGIELAAVAAIALAAAAVGAKVTKPRQPALHAVAVLLQSTCHLRIGLAAVNAVCGSDEARLQAFRSVAKEASITGAVVQVANSFFGVEGPGLATVDGFLHVLSVPGFWGAKECAARVLVTAVGHLQARVDFHTTLRHSIVVNKATRTLTIALEPNHALAEVHTRAGRNAGGIRMAVTTVGSKAVVHGRAVGAGPIALVCILETARQAFADRCGVDFGAVRHGTLIKFFGNGFQNRLGNLPARHDNVCLGDAIQDVGRALAEAPVAPAEIALSGARGHQDASASIAGSSPSTFARALVLGHSRLGAERVFIAAVQQIAYAVNINMSNSAQWNPSPS
jgi:hypothetical protein